MTHTRDEILAMDAAQLRLAIAEAKGLDTGSHDTHEWHKEPGGDIDLYAYSSDPHSGPYCDRCGYSFCTGCNEDGYNDYLPCTAYHPDWATSIPAAWRLVEEMRDAGQLVIIKLWPDKSFIFSIEILWKNDSDGYVQTVSDTAPLAICRAWLMWKEGAK